MTVETKQVQMALKITSASKPQAVGGVARCSGKSASGKPVKTAA